MDVAPSSADCVALIHWWREQRHAERNDACIIRLSRIAVIGLILLTKDSKVRSTPPRNERGRVSKQSILSEGTPLRGCAVAVP
jgi:hypothetical protein